MFLSAENTEREITNSVVQEKLKMFLSTIINQIFRGRGNKNKTNNANKGETVHCIRFETIVIPPPGLTKKFVHCLLSSDC